MAFVVKQHGERREELLDMALVLFHRHGYEATSVASIIDAVGVSKGTFYHYFRSKEELLDAIVARMTEQVLAKVHDALSPDGMTAVDRFNAFLGASIQWKVARKDAIMSLIRALYCDENLRMRRKINERSRSALEPLLIDIVRQGIEEGTFVTPDAEETVAMFLDVAFSVGERIATLILGLPQHPENGERLRRKLIHYQVAVERIFGVREGSLRLVEDGQAFLDAILDAEGPG